MFKSKETNVLLLPVLSAGDDPTVIPPLLVLDTNQHHWCFCTKLMFEQLYNRHDVFNVQRDDVCSIRRSRAVMQHLRFSSAGDCKDKQNKNA